MHFLLRMVNFLNRVWENACIKCCKSIKFFLKIYFNAKFISLLLLFLQHDFSLICVK